MHNIGEMGCAGFMAVIAVVLRRKLEESEEYKRHAAKLTYYSKRM